MRKNLFLIATVAAIALSAAPAAFAVDPARGSDLFAAAAGQPIGSVVWISANTRSSNGKYLRVAIAGSNAGAGAVLQEPENRPNFPNRRRAQQWRVARNFAADSSTSIRFRNIYSDMCLTAARPRGSPVYLQNCGSSSVRPGPTSAAGCSGA